MENKSIQGREADVLSASSSVSKSGNRMGGNRSNRSSLKGKNSWVLSKKDVLPKLRDYVSYVGVFGGMSLAISVVIFATTWLSGVLGFFGGASIASLAYLFRDWNKTSVVIYVDDSGDELTKQHTYVKRFFFYLVSVLGTAGIIGSIFLLFRVGFTVETGVLLIACGNLVYLSRYVKNKSGFFRILDDYLMIVLIFGGFYGFIYGWVLFSTSPIIGVCVSSLGFILTPVCLFFREKSLFSKRRLNLWRKFFSLLVTTSSLMVLVGLPFFIVQTGIDGTVVSFLLLESVLVALGGIAITEGRSLVSLKDIL